VVHAELARRPGRVGQEQHADAVAGDPVGDHPPVLGVAHEDAEAVVVHEVA
jgi:hypothetical protein